MGVGKHVFTPMACREVIKATIITGGWLTSLFIWLLLVYPNCVGVVGQFRSSHEYGWTIVCDSEIFRWVNIITYYKSHDSHIKLSLIEMLMHLAGNHIIQNPIFGHVTLLVGILSHEKEKQIVVVLFSIYVKSMEQ